MNFTATTRVEFDPRNTNEEAGFILLNNGTHFDIMVHTLDGKRYVRVRLQFGSTIYESEEYALNPGPVDLRIEGERTTFTFSFSQGGDDYTEIETVDSKFLSSETAGGFTGVYVGFYATGNGAAAEANADYDWFEYTHN